MNVMSIFDPIGVTDLAQPVMRAEQTRELDEKYRRVDEEVQKALAEVEAIKAQNQAREAVSKPRRRARQTAE